MVDFSTTITIGNIIEVLVVGTGGLIFLFEIKNKLGIISTNQDFFAKRLDKLDQEIQALAKISSTMSAQNERMISFEQRVTSHTERMNKLEEKLESIHSAIRESESKLEERFINALASINSKRRKAAG